MVKILACGARTLASILTSLDRIEHPVPVEEQTHPKHSCITVKCYIHSLDNDAIFSDITNSGTILFLILLDSGANRYQMTLCAQLTQWVTFQLQNMSYFDMNWQFYYRNVSDIWRTNFLKNISDKGKVFCKHWLILKLLLSAGPEHFWKGMMLTDNRPAVGVSK